MLRAVRPLYTGLIGCVAGILIPGCFENSSGSESSGGATDGSTSETSEGTTDTTDSSSASASGGMTSGGCPDGSAGCPCYGNGTCDADLLCQGDICLPPGCTPGVEGCPCMDGACLGSLVCNNGLCEQPPDTGTSGATATAGGSTGGATTGGTTDGTTTDATATTGNPPDGMYSACTDDSDCSNVTGGVCVFNEGATTGMCTTPCSSDADCPAYVGAGKCTDVAGNLVCVPLCSAEDECPPQFTCAGGLCY